MVVAVPFCPCIKSCFDYHVNNQDHANNHLVQHLLDGSGNYGYPQALFVNLFVQFEITTYRVGYHVWHCEQGDIATSRRMAFIILYLNDINLGGETEFIYQSARVHPMQGRLVLAPSSYTHTHRGNPPLDGAKYILTSWLEFQQ